MADIGIPDLWPTDIGSMAVQTPLSILRQQASALARHTQGLVEGEVDVKSFSDQEIMLVFKLVVPAMDNYTYQLFSLVHPVTLYPVRAYTGAADAPPVPGGLVLRSQEDLIAFLKNLFSSAGTKRIVAALVAQSKS